MSKADAVLIVGGGLLQAPLVLEAQRLGLLPIVTDRNPQAPAFAHAYEHYMIDTYDIAKHVALVKELRSWEPTTGVHLCGVVCCGNDVAPTVAAAAHEAGLPGIPPEVARLTHDKAAVRFALTGAGLAHYQPRWLWRQETCTQGLEAEVAETCGYPCVVKPLEQRASRGVSIVYERQALAPAVQKAFEYGPSYLVEQCLVGTEHSAEMIFGLDGAPAWFNVVDRFFCYEDSLALETGHVNPSQLAPRIQDDIVVMLGEAAQALGVTWGPFKADIMITDDGPKILEVTARLSGGWDCQGTSPLTGRHPMRALLQLACGLSIDAPLTWAPTQGYGACAAILTQRSGRVVRLPNRYDTMLWLENERMHPGPHIADIIWAIMEGENIHPAIHNGERAGYVLAHAPTFDEAWQRAKTAADALAESVEIL